MELDIEDSQFIIFGFPFKVGVYDDQVIIFFRRKLQGRLKKIRQDVAVPLIAENQLKDKVQGR
jgi:hypothetical protein